MEFTVKRRAGRLTYIYLASNVVVTCYKLEDGDHFLDYYTDCTARQYEKLNDGATISVNLIESFDRYLRWLSPLE